MSLSLGSLVSAARAQSSSTQASLTEPGSAAASGTASGSGASGSGTSGNGQASVTVSRRKYKPLRDDESWAWLREAQATGDLWDPLKYVPLSRREGVFLTFGGEVRQWVEGYHHEQWGQTGEAVSVSWLQRYMLHADAHLTPYARAFVQLKSGIEVGRKGGPRPPDEDLLDINQAYVDAVAIPGASPDAEPKLLARIGRQEMSYGSGRFVDVREGPNVRFGHDGVRIIARPGPVRVDAFAVRPQLTKPGVFDDATSTSQALWGVYGTLALDQLVVDTYYLGVHRTPFRYQRISGDEERHTFGARARAKLTVAEVEVEGAYQLGAIGGTPISAWTLAMEAVLRGAELPLKPAMTWGFGVTSGDRGPRSTSLGTFNPLFPRGAYFGLVSANGPENNVSPHVALALALPADLSVSGEVWAFWRQSLEDGIYNVPGALLRPGTPRQARYVGTQVQGFVSWQADRHLSFTGTLAVFDTGAFFDTSAPGEDIVYGATWATYKF
ncbi:alginate export family protein [Chondromyces apiculatus]|uniref:alginate export family protein n=1 Tax=Chondromyces apiculatus TaxID=51 RepID=UPI0018CC144D|nr:alginate export family protein [Chondromyces apiculatus]